jgi:predicted metal-dependent hydrolase
MTVADDTLLRRGVMLFNEGDYFACHEVWEELWKHSAGETRIALQGLIQAAAALLHAKRGNLRGARSVYRRAAANLEIVTSNCLGIDSITLRASLAQYFRRLENGDRTLEPPRIFSRLIG